MKRILILCITCIMLMSVVASAKINMGRDNFSQGLYVSSWQYPTPDFDTLNFHKEFIGKESNFKISLSCARMKDGVLGNAPIEIKIDNNPVYELKDYKFKLTGPDSYGVKYNSVIDVKFPVELVDKIKDAKRVAIRYEDAMGMRWPYLLPDNVLAEWKEVINATEWDILESIDKKK